MPVRTYWLNMANTSQMEQLQASGMDRKTAEAISNVIARAIEDAKPAASTGSIGWLGVGTLLASVGMMMGVVIWQSDAIRSDMRAEIGSLRDDFRAEIGGVRSDMRAEFSSVRAEMGSIRAEMGEMQEKIGSMQEKIGSMQEKIGSVQEKIGSVQEKIGSVQEKIGSMQEEISKMRTELDEVRSAISALGEQMIRFEMLIQDRLPSAP